MILSNDYGNEGRVFSISKASENEDPAKQAAIKEASQLLNSTGVRDLERQVKITETSGAPVESEALVPLMASPNEAIIVRILFSDYVHRIDRENESFRRFS